MIFIVAKRRTSGTKESNSKANQGDAGSKDEEKMVCPNNKSSILSLGKFSIATNY